MSLWRSNVRLTRILLRCPYSIATTSNPATTPSLLVKVRSDMKDAMKAKDSSRLDVLRGLIADVTNAAKTSKPVTSDGQMLNIIRKRIKNSEAAVQEFQNANRDDLKDREVAQIAVLESYIGENSSMGEEDITRVIQDVIGTLRTEEKNVNQGSVMKALVGPGGSLESQAVDNQIVAKLVKGITTQFNLKGEALTFDHSRNVMRQHGHHYVAIEQALRSSVRPMLEDRIKLK